MYGQKQIISCLGIVLLVSVFNFYRSVIRRDKEQRQYTEQTQRNRQQLERERISRENAAYESQLRQANQRLQRAKMLEYRDTCPDLHVLVYRPGEYDDIATITASTLISPPIINNSNIPNNENYDAVDKSIVASATHHIHCKDASSSIDVPPLPTKSKPKIMDQIRESSAGIIYLVVMILLVSLGKAAFDLSKQFKVVSVLLDRVTKIMFLSILKSGILSASADQDSHRRRTFTTLFASRILPNQAQTKEDRWQHIKRYS